MKKQFAFAGMLLLCALYAIPQNIDKEKVTVTYLQLPSNPVDKGIKNYQAEVILTWEDELADKHAAANAQNASAAEIYEKELAVWENQCAQARELHAKEMETWNKKSALAKKVDAANKPVLRLPSKPYLRKATVNDDNKDYDKEMLRDSYLSIEGFDKAPDNALNFTLKIYKWQQSYSVESKKTRKKNSAGEYYEAMTYYYKVEYKLPMAVKVVTPDGKTLINEMFAPSDENRTWNSTAYNSKYELSNKVDIRSRMDRLHDDAVKDNVMDANDYINDLYGYPLRERKVTLYTAKSKKEDFSDFDLAKSRFKEAAGNMKDGGDISGFEDASNAFSSALDEAEGNVKKSRIKKFAIELLFLTAETKAFFGDYDGALAQLDRLSNFDPKKKDIIAEEKVREFVVDLKERKEANPEG